ncbi:MAG: response regulator, partial [Lachnospiraceae bacterium]|nr:response regulator [Lachnospiraceae bacterium]
MYKVLIVEDDPMVAMINEQYIEKNELFRVVNKVNNGEEAIAYLKEISVDLIIMDVYMPRLSGIETLREIRRLDINTPVIMVTAANDGKTFEEAMTLGAIDYLVKPFAYER